MASIRKLSWLSVIFALFGVLMIAGGARALVQQKYMVQADATVLRNIDCPDFGSVVNTTRYCRVEVSYLFKGQPFVSNMRISRKSHSYKTKGNKIPITIDTRDPKKPRVRGLFPVRTASYILIGIGAVLLLAAMAGPVKFVGVE